VFSKAFELLNNTMDGSCYYVGKPGEENMNTMGYYEAPFVNIFPENTWPAYSVVPKHAGDIKKALAFARTFHLKVNLKVNGHSLSGGSSGALPETGKTTMIIFMRDFTNIDVHEQGWKDTCGTLTPTAFTAGGGVYFAQLYKKMLDYNYSFVGGTCDSVAINGGWILSGGMSQMQQRSLGLGIDSVLQFEVMLSTGQTLIVDKCSNAPLFKALRGGGGGLAIILAATHTLFPGTQAQLYNFAFSNKTTAVNYTRWFEALVKHTPTMDNRFTFEPSAFQRKNWGYPSPDAMWTVPGQAHLRLYFLGTAAEAERHPVYKDFKKLLDEVPAAFRNYTHLSWSTLAGLKAERAWQTFGDWGDKSRSFEHPESEGPAGGWSIPMKFLVDHPVESTRLFEEWSEDLQNCKASFTYQYGGQINKNKWMSRDQVNQGNLRDWGWFFFSCSKQYLKKLAKMFPVEDGGGWSPNHYIEGNAESLSTNYIDGQWGQQNYIYLLGLKQFYDPDNLLGCRICVAWPPSLKNYTAFITNPMYLENSLHMYAPDPFLDSMKKDYFEVHDYKNQSDAFSGGSS